MKIVDSYGINDGSIIFSVELAADRFVDVKVCPDGGLTYVMENEDGSTVYSDRAYSDKGIDFTYPGFEYDEKAVLDLVRTAVVLMDENVLESLDVPAMLVEEVGGGEFRRYALTPEEFEKKFGQPRVVAFSSDGWKLFSVRCLPFLSDSVGIWCRRGVTRDDFWEKFFSDMTYGISKDDIEAGFRACVREDLMGDLREYLSDNKQMLKGINNMDERFEELKRELFMGGIDDIEDFLGYEIDPEEDKDVTERRMNMVYEQMPEEELEKFYMKHGIQKGMDAKVVSREIYENWRNQPILHDEDMWMGRYKTYGEMWAGEGYVIEGMERIRVAIESTDDYSNSEFHSRLVDSDVRNEDGTYGRVVDYYRIVAINENGRIDKFDDRVFESAEDAKTAVLSDARLELVSYDELVHEAGKGLGVDALLCDAKNRTVPVGASVKDKTIIME